MVMFTVAQAGAAKIETQYRESETVQRLHRVKDHFIVQCPAIERVGMTHQGSVSGIRRACIQQRLKLAGRAVQLERPDCVVWLIHVALENSIAALFSETCLRRCEQPVWAFAEDFRMKISDFRIKIPHSES